MECIVNVYGVSFSINHEGNEGKCFYLGKNNYYELRKNVLRELADGFSCIHDNFKYFKTLNKNKIKVIVLTPHSKCGTSVRES